VSESRETKSCFVISPIGAEDSDTRRRADQVLKHVIAPVAEALHYRVTRADKIAEPGIINSQVIQHIVEDDLVIADLTDMNPNVFYELAIRHALRRPYVQIMQKGQTIPFDIAGVRTIFFDHKDLDSVDDAKRQIIAQINSIEKQPGLVDSPVSVSLDLQVLKQSSDPSQRSVAEVIDQLSDLRREFLSFKDDALKVMSVEKRGGLSERGLSNLYKQLGVVRHDAIKILEQMDACFDVMKKNSYSGDFDEKAKGLRQLNLENLLVLRIDLGHVINSLRLPDDVFG
jgi:hypothetical protein